MPVIGWKVGNESDPNDRIGEEQAKIALYTLCKVYPGYSWIVEIRGGMLLIRNYTLDWRGRWCMALKMGDIQHNHKRFVKSVSKAAGEFLERAHQRRGPMAPGQESSPVLEGAPTIGAKRWSPLPKSKNMGIIVPDEEVN